MELLSLFTIFSISIIISISKSTAKANKSKLDFIQLKVYERVIQLNMEELLERQREALSDYEVEEDTEE